MESEKSKQETELRHYYKARDGPIDIKEEPNNFDDKSRLTQMGGKGLPARNLILNTMT